MLRPRDLGGVSLLLQLVSPCFMRRQDVLMGQVWRAKRRAQDDPWVSTLNSWVLGELPEESIPAPSTKVTLISECGGAFVEIWGGAPGSLPCSCLERLHPGSQLRPWHASPPVPSPITAPASLPAPPQHFSASATLNFQPLAQTLALLRTVLSPSHSAASIYRLPAGGQTLVEALYKD